MDTHSLGGSTKVYLCEHCGIRFESEWTEEDARREAVENGWGDVPAEELAVICDDCYRFLTALVPPPSWKS